MGSCAGWLLAYGFVSGTKFYLENNGVALGPKTGHGALGAMMAEAWGTFLFTYVILTSTSGVGNKDHTIKSSKDGGW